MPIFNRRDSHGPYYQYGEHGTKYYYISGNVTSRNIAYEKAYAQVKAAHARRGT